MRSAAQSAVMKWRRSIFLAVLCCAAATSGRAVSAQADPSPSSDGRTLLYGITGCTDEVIFDKELTCLIWKHPESYKNKTHPLRFAVHTQPGAELILEDKQAGSWFRRGVQLGATVVTGDLGDGLLRAAIPEGTATLTLSARDQRSGQDIGQVTLHLDWEVPGPLDTLITKAKNYATPAQRQEIFGQLKRELEQAQNSVERTKILIHIAQLHKSYLSADKKLNPVVSSDQIQEVRRAVESALASAEPLRRMRSSALLLSMLAFLAHEDSAEQTRLLPRLESNVARLKALPSEQSQLYYYLAEIAQWNNDLRNARSYLESSDAAAKWIGEPTRDARWLREQFSEGVNVEQELKQQELAARQEKSACKKASLLQNIAWIRLLNWELAPDSSEGKTPGAPRSGNATDSLQLFNEVFALSSGPGAQCPNARRAQYALSSRARRLSLLPPSASDRLARRFSDWVAQVQHTIDDARALSAPAAPQPNVELDLQFAAARLELAQSHIEEAAERFSALAEMTAKSSRIEDRWEAVCGAAATQALLEQAEPKQKRVRVAQKGHLLDDCSELLDSLVGKVGLVNQARALEPRDLRLGRLLSLLRLRDNQALLPEVLKTMRRASRRALAPYRWPFVHEGQLSKELLALRDEYYKVRANFEEELKQTWPRQQVAGFDKPADVQGRVDKRRRALELLDQAFVKLRGQSGVGSAWRTLPELQSDELLLICHSQGIEEEQSLFCITALGKELRSVQLAPQSLSKAELAEKIFGPWRAKLPSLREDGPAAPIQRLRVIAHGWLREQDLVGWPLDGKPLIARLPIVYSLDIEPLPPQPGDGAVFAIHPGSDLGGADATIQMLHEHLQLLAPKPRYFSVDIAQFSAAPVDKDTHYSRLYPVHNRASLFAALGHFKPALCSSDPSPLGTQGAASSWLTSLCLPGRNSIWPADVLLAPQVPQTVLLLGCSSSKQAERLSASSVSMASAYVLRGSHAVLGTVRDILRPLAQQTLCHITNDPRFNTPQFDLAVAVQQAQKAIINGTSCPGGVAASELANPDWTALRVYVP